MGTENYYFAFDDYVFCGNGWAFIPTQGEFFYASHGGDQHRDLKDCQPSSMNVMELHGAR